MNTNFFFVLKIFLKAFFSPGNILTLMMRFFTVFLVMFHYQIIEGIDYWSQAVRTNEWPFGKLIVTWHIVFMMLKVFDERKLQATPEPQRTMKVIIGGIFAVPSILVTLLTPILAWFNFQFTLLDTSYWTLRYLIMLPYIILNALSSVFPHLKNFAFLITDGVILSQLTSIYLYNEFSMNALLTIMPVLFVLQNHMLVDGIFSFVQDEHEQRLTFVRLIGRHDAVFLYVIYGIFIAIFTSVDLFSTGELRFAANFWYVPYALYAFAKLMDHKQSSSKFFWTLSLLSVIAFVGIYLFTIKYHVVPFPDRVFPLYAPTNATMIGNDTVSLNETSSLNSTIMGNVTEGNNVTINSEL